MNALQSDTESDILIVDDQERNLDALSIVLAKPGYNLIRAGSANEALKRVLERDFAVILLDVNMPEVDGFECARLIKRRQQSADVPIIFVTAIANDLSFIFQGYRSGAVDYITKPIEPEVVRAKVAVFVQLFRAKRLLHQQLEETRALVTQLEIDVARGQKDQRALVLQLRNLLESFESRLNPEAPVATVHHAFVHNGSHQALKD